MTRWNVLCKIFRRSKSRGPKLRVGWLVFNLFIFYLFIRGCSRRGIKNIWCSDKEVYKRIRSNYRRNMWLIREKI